jgi:hypothetical protein
VRPSPGRWAGAAGLLATLALAGCAEPPLSTRELPPQPIVLVHRTPEEGRHRAEALQRSRSEEEPREEGVARVKEIAAFFGGGRAALPLEYAGEVAFLDPTTGTLTPLAGLPRGAQPLSWTPGHRRFVYAVARPDRTPVQVFEYDVTTAEVLPLASGASNVIAAAIAADGRLALVCLLPGRPLRTRILVQEPGQKPRVLTQGPLDRSPVWSPDSRTLVYVARSANGKDELVALRMDPDADEPNEPRVLARGKDPVFTPDGEWVVYSASTSAGQRLWRVRPDGGGRAPLGQGLHDEVHPAVSPDGRFVAYVSQEADRDTLRVRRFDGSGDRLLLEAGDGSTPAW